MFRNFSLYVFVAFKKVLMDKCSHCFLVCNLRMVLEKVRFDTRRSLKPFKDLKDRFDPLTPLTKCSPTVHVFYAI